MNKRIIGSIILGVLFVILTILIITNNINGFDTSIYKLVTLKMNNIITNIYKVFTFLGSTIFMVSFCTVLFFLFIILKKKNISFILASSLIISTIFNNVIKLIIRRPRPEVLKLVVEKSFSFPSGHTMAAVTMYGMLLFVLLRTNGNKKIKSIIGSILIVLPIIIAISRIYLGAHFASDVIGGAIFSSMLLLIETYIIDKKKWI
jgi:undecaprenyl-diphosphatase